MVKIPKFKVYRDKIGEYRFHLRSSNGRDILHSEGYATKELCINMIKLIINELSNSEVTIEYVGLNNIY